MKKLCLTLVLIISCLSLSAQPGRQGRGRGQMPNLEKYLEDRISFVTKAMHLDPADSIKFVPLYKEKLKAKGESMFKNHSRQRIMPNQEYADSVYINAVMAEAQYKIDDANIDMEYLKKFEKILTPKQLFRYIQAEKMFVGSFMLGGGPNGQRGRGPQRKPE